MQAAAKNKKEQIESFRKGAKDLADSRQANDNSSDGDGVSSEDTEFQKDIRKKKMRELLGFPLGNENNDRSKEHGSGGTKCSRFLKLKAKMLEEERSGVRPAWERFYSDTMLHKEKDAAKIDDKENEIEKINVDEYSDELEEVQMKAKLKIH